ncbi:MAG: hypothetical protein HZA51_03940 [Planctomycetes bacterium]|nr:hypothetical protein [Planctomycetota bacterium]
MATNRTLSLRLASLSYLCLVPTFMGLGCGEGDTTMVVKKPASERPDVDRAVAGKGSLVVPTAEAFNYSSFNSGQTGTARGEAALVGKDGARCAAQAGDGGSAWAEFQIGYTFDNTTGGPLDASVKLKLRLAQTQSTSGPSTDSHGIETTGKSALRFFIKDSVGLTIKAEDVATSTLMKGPTSHTDTHDIVFDARFEPDRGYYLVLAGRIDVQASGGGNATLAMDVQQAAMEIAWRPSEAKTASAE